MYFEVACADSHVSCKHALRSRTCDISETPFTHFGSGGNRCDSPKCLRLLMRRSAYVVFVLQTAQHVLARYRVGVAQMVERHRFGYFGGPFRLTAYTKPN